MTPTSYDSLLGFDPSECVSKYLLHHPAQTSAPKPVTVTKPKPKWVKCYKARRDAYYAVGLTANGKKPTGRWHRRPELAGLDTYSTAYHTAYKRMARAEQRRKYGQIFY